ncbi:MAG: prolipoprotein diacylglyceryl transferase [Spirochaetales bacterium]|nr:prolipoprotein diacylglyceryl transferase [Spirochaetales bacterium]
MSLFINYPSWISPYVIKGLPIRWYAVMYVFAFATAYILFMGLLKEKENRDIKKESAEDLFIYCVIGLLIGARLGSCLFYDDALYYFSHPWLIFWPFRNGEFVGLPGMSYHGGVIGAIVAGLIYTKVKKISFLRFADLITSAIPFAYTWGRLGNFINGELYGRVTTSRMGMVFPTAERFSTTHQWVRSVADTVGIVYSPGDYVNLPRWPSQLFEAFFEGIVLGIIIWFVVRKIKKKRNMADGTILASYLMGYGLIRFILEYFRQPDSDIGYVIGHSSNIYLFESVLNISKGQVFCLLMVIGGLALLLCVNLIAKRNRKYDKRKN